MRYVSTRGGAPARSFSDIVLEGLAPDGGLYLPEGYPTLHAGELIDAWQRGGYPELAVTVMAPFIDDISHDDLVGLCRNTYTEQVYRTPQIAPLRELGDNTWLLGLSNGPTLAFKDMAMQFLGALFEHVLSERDETITILGATSGDTGSAAEYAMRGRERVRVFMLSPYGRMSPFQQAQMYSLDEPNIFNIAVRGVFDDCQDLVKAVASDLPFKAAHRIGAVNSINWARVLAQVVYYCAAWVQAHLTTGAREIDVTVPTGNFGNILAGHIARQCGVGIERLIVATNENNVLHEFFTTGVYRPRSATETVATSSPSMDISRASNFERFIADLLDRDAQRVADLFTRLRTDGAFDLSCDPAFASITNRYGFISGTSTHADRMATIARVYRDHGQVIDPHTADGVTVAAEHHDALRPMVVLETALPAKFADTIREAIGQDPQRPADLEGLEDLPRHVEVIDNDVATLKAYISEH